MIGFHLEMSEEKAPDSLASAYMSIMEHLMLFTLIRVHWNHNDKNLIKDTLFIKDGPLSLNSQYVKLVDPIRNFLEYAKNQSRPINIIGQEKSGKFVDHLSTFVQHIKPKDFGEPMSYLVLSHEYVNTHVQDRPTKINYGKRSNWGEKIFVKYDPTTFLVLNIPTGFYLDLKDAPGVNDLIGLDNILATLPQIISHRYSGGLYPIELANGIASLSSYPSSKILERFLSSI